MVVGLIFAVFGFGIVHHRRTPARFVRFPGDEGVVVEDLDHSVMGTEFFDELDEIERPAQVIDLFLFFFSVFIPDDCVGSVISF